MCYRAYRMCGYETWLACCLVVCAGVDGIVYLEGGTEQSQLVNPFVQVQE